MAAILPAIVEEQPITIQNSLEAGQSFTTDLASGEPTESPASDKPKADQAGATQSDDRDTDDSKDIEIRLAEVIVTNKIEEILAEAKTLAGIELVSSAEPLVYSLSISPEQMPVAPIAGDPVHPFVPSNSFYYKVTEDTALPKKSPELPAIINPGLVKSFASIQDINWLAIEQILREKGETVNLPKLQLEVQKAVAVIDWKELAKDLENAGEETSSQLQKYREQAVNRYLRFQKEKAEKAVRQRQATEEMIRERLHQKTPAAPKSPKKIVNI
jgi:hypothetical protein